MKVHLERFCHSEEMGTFGRMSVGGVTLYTVERPWLDNRPNVSCIPAGVYTCRKRFFYKGQYPTHEIENVPGRSHILFHRGNTMDHVRGCIALGSDLGWLNEKWAVTSSREAWGVWRAAMGEIETFELEIVSFSPLPATVAAPGT